jgi:hypothetical protein
MENMDEKTLAAITRSSLTEKLVEINELIDLLGYTDERSIEAWCKKNKIPLFHVGKKTYTIRNFLDMFISQKLEEYVKATYKNADVILKAINEDDKIELSKQLSAPLDKATLTKFKKKADSKEATDFMNKLKAA